MKEDELVIPACRHNFPKYPVPRSVIIRKFVVSEDNTQEAATAKKNLEKIKKYIIRQTSTDEKKKIFNAYTFEAFLSNLGLSYEQYLVALSTSIKHDVAIFPKRLCSDVYINQFNIKVMKDDASNHDVQVLLNKEESFATGTYLTKYVTKEESGQSSLLKAVEEQSALAGDSPDVKLKKLANVLDATREVGLQEIIYRLLGFQMSKFSRVCKFINTSPPSKRDGLLKPNIDELKENESPFFNSIVDYYMNRASGMENLSLAEFSSEYDIQERSSKCFRKNDQIAEDDNNDENDDDEDDDERNRGRKSSREQTKNPDLTLLKNMGSVRKRKKRAILRYHTGQRVYDSEEYIKILMFLFCPFRDELNEVFDNKNIMKKYADNQDKVLALQKEFDPYPNFMEELGNVDISQMEDEDIEIIEEETTSAKELEDFMKKATNIHDGSKIRLEELKKVNDQINTLNFQQRKFLDELLNKDDDDQYFIYLYGRAGTGKSYLLNVVIPALEFKFLKSGVDLEKPLVVVMAPTASAAKNLTYGDTIHGSLKFFGNDSLEEVEKISGDASLACQMQQVKVIIIDEISMVGSNFFFQIHQKLSQNLGKEPFGGISVICTGDFGQLPPVLSSWIFQRATVRSRANFTAKYLWHEHFTMYKLTEHVRSGGDSFYSMLQEQVAKGMVTNELVAAMEARVVDCPSEFDNELYKNGSQVLISLSHAVKDQFNSSLIDKLAGEHFTFHAIDTKTPKTKTLPTPEDLEGINEVQLKGLPTQLVIKRNAPIKITKNIHKKDKLTNGTFGYVLDFDIEKGIIWCRFNDEKVGAFRRSQCKIKCNLDKLAVPITKVKDSISFTSKSKKTFNFKREAFPLILAYAITCHASQGLTKDRVLIDFRGGIPKHGMLFVAFSRAKTLEGVFLKDFDPSYIKCDPNVSRELERLETSGQYKCTTTFNHDRVFISTETNMPAKEVKCTYLNVNGLLHGNHFPCLKNDINILHSDLVCISESRLSPDIKDNDINIDGFILKSRLDQNNKVGTMGMVLYAKYSVILDIFVHCDLMWQCITAETNTVLIHFVYIHPKAKETNYMDFVNYVASFNSSSGLISVIGDMNIRSEVGATQPKLLHQICDQLSLSNTFIKTTHSSGGQLDYVLLSDQFSFRYLSGVFRNLYSDHSAVYLRFSCDKNVTLRTNIKDQSDNSINQNPNPTDESPCIKNQGNALCSNENQNSKSECLTSPKSKSSSSSHIILETPSNSTPLEITLPSNSQEHPILIESQVEPRSTNHIFNKLKIHITTGNLTDIVSRRHDITLNKDDYKSLVDGNGLLHDTIVNEFFNLIKERNENQHLETFYFFNTFVFEMLQRNLDGDYLMLTENWIAEDLTTLKKIFIPLFKSNHWTLIIVKIESRTIELYDSIESTRQGSSSLGLKLFKKFFDKYFEERGKAGEFSTFIIHDTPVQQNCVDCGVFMTQNAERLSRDALLAKQEDIPQARVKMAVEIYRGKLLSSSEE